MKFKSENMTQASGSIAGVTYAHSKGGTLYRRSRAIPVNPQTPAQVQVRIAFAAAVGVWSSVLTQAQRDAWDLYAANVLVTNSLGDQVQISGQNWFIAANTPRVQAQIKLVVTVPTVLTAPGIFNRGTIEPVTVEYSAANGLEIIFDDTEDWCDEDGSALLVYQGRPQSNARNFFKGPYRLVEAILGDSTTPPTSSVQVSAANMTARGYPVVVNQDYNTYAVLSQADGRLTARQILPKKTAGV